MYIYFFPPGVKGRDLGYPKKARINDLQEQGGYVEMTVAGMVVARVANMVKGGGEF